MKTEGDLFHIDAAGTTPFSEVRLNRTLEAVRIGAEALHPDLYDNLLRLTETKILGDELAAIGYFTAVVDHLESTAGGSDRFSEEAITLVCRSTILSDAGKAGWQGARPDQKRVVTQLHSEDRSFDLHRTLEEYIDEFFHNEDELQQQRLAQNPDTYSAEDLKRQVAMMTDQGITLEMSMREFFDLHVRWSYGLITTSNLSRNQEIAVTAGLHHFLEANLPFSINAATEDISSLITREVIWVILLDKYDAQIRRSKANPTEAIQWLYTYIEEGAHGFALIQDKVERRNLQDRFRAAISELASSLGV